MFTINPFTELSQFVSPTAIQAYVIIMALLVVAGTVLDTLHKKSAQWFFENKKRGKESATREVSAGENISIGFKVATQEILASAEFENTRRRISHLFTMYGFIIFVLMTVIMVFFYAGADASTPVIWPLLWHLGALMLAFGGYWFWFSIRVDVSAEGKPWYKLAKADMFIVSLLATSTFALIWSFTQWVGSSSQFVFFGLLVLSSFVLFAGVLWSKFAHMFYKPAAAFQKRVTRADGSAENLPMLSRDEPEQQKRHSMELLKDAPMDMGLGIKRERPNHF